MNALSERPDTTAAPSPTVRSRAALLAAVAYLLTWVAGLSVFSSSTRVDSSGEDVLASFRGHHAAAVTQYVLTEGLTAVLLVLALWPLGRALAGRTVLIAALSLATAVSFAEFALGVRLVTGDLGPATAATVNDAVNRLDGVKMLGLAVVLAVVTLGVRRTSPRWFVVLGTGTVFALVLSGVGYLALDDTLAACAWASLPLLIASVLAVGVRTGRGTVQLSRSARTSGFSGGRFSGGS